MEKIEAPDGTHEHGAPKSQGTAILVFGRGRTVLFSEESEWRAARATNRAPLFVKRAGDTADRKPLTAFRVDKTVLRARATARRRAHTEDLGTCHRASSRAHRGEGGCHRVSHETDTEQRAGDTRLRAYDTVNMTRHTVLPGNGHANEAMGHRG